MSSGESEAGMSDDDLHRVYGEAWLATLAPHDHLAGLRAVERAAREAALREAADYCDSLVADEIATGKVDHNEMAWTQACAIALRARAEGSEHG